MLQMQEPTSLHLDEVAAGGGNVIDPDLVVDGYLNHMDSAMVGSKVSCPAALALSQIRAWSLF